MSASDPHRVLVDDLHAEIRRLRSDLERVEAELRQALWHLNPPVSASASAAQDATEAPIGSDLAGRPRDLESIFRPLSRPESGARLAERCPEPAEPTETSDGGTFRPSIRSMPDASPVTVLPGITVSPSVLRARSRPLSVEGDGVGVDDDEPA